MKSFSHSNYELGLIKVTDNFLANLKSPGSLENLLFQRREGFVELPNFLFGMELICSKECDFWKSKSNK